MIWSCRIDHIRIGAKFAWFQTWQPIDLFKSLSHVSSYTFTSIYAALYQDVTHKLVLNVYHSRKKKNLNYLLSHSLPNHQCNWLLLITLINDWLIKCYVLGLQLVLKVRSCFHNSKPSVCCWMTNVSMVIFFFFCCCWEFPLDKLVMK